MAPHVRKVRCGAIFDERLDLNALFENHAGWGFCWKEEKKK